MPVETATYVNELNASNPVGASDTVSSLDNHDRLIKATLLNSFPNIGGAMNASHTELNNLVGVTGKTGTGNVVLSASPTLTGTITGGTFSGTHSGNGAALTNLAAGSLASGSVPDARIAASSVTQHEGSIDHDALLNFVANEHINHASVSITAGDGLSGGGNITASRSLAVDSTVLRTTGAQTVSGTKTFNASQRFLDIITLEQEITPTELSGGGSSNNYAPTGHASATMFRLSSAGAHSLTGLAGGTHGRLVYIFNIGSNAITLLHENASSTAANRFHAPGGGGGGESIGAGRGIAIMYDGNSSRWRAISRAT